VVRVLLFGRLADVGGWRERTVDPAPATLFELRRRLTRDDPRLGPALDARGVQVAVDLTLVRGDVALRDGCEVAFMPPMSGG
jgi:molybdopterin synthase sulfur carrier subunit